MMNGNSAKANAIEELKNDDELRNEISSSVTGSTSTGTSTTTSMAEFRNFHSFSE